ncbi:MAG: glycosyltransferase [Solirubrobacteraceae bacterium]
MEIRWIDSAESIGARRGEVVACIPVYGGHELFVECLHSVIAHTAASVPIMILDDASPDGRTRAHVGSLEQDDDERRLFYLRRERNIGFPANVNGAFAATAPADVVVLNSDCVVAEGWLENLRDAAYDSARVATATALTNHGSIVSTPNPRDRGAVSLRREDLDRAAAAVRGHSRRLRPRLPTAIGHCMYVRRSALELVGEFDTAFTPGYGEEVDFSQRCLLSGLSHVLADDVLVLHHGGGSFTLNGDRQSLQEAHERIIAVRYPFYHDGLRSLEHTPGPLSRALNVARRALTGLAVTVDLRGVAEEEEADDERVVGLLEALAQTGEVRLTVLIGAGCPPAIAGALTGVPDLTLCSEAELSTAERADVVHRSHPVAGAATLAELSGLGERVILTGPDLPRYHNPAYLPDPAAWQSHRTLTSLSLADADGVVFDSDSARAEAVAEGLVDPRRAHTVHGGVEHFTAQRIVARPPVGVRGLPATTETILCLAPSFRHTNRVFALKVVAQLQLHHDWGGRLLLVGREVRYGSSFAEEQRCLAADPRLAQATIILPAADSAERAWLLARSRLVLHCPVDGGRESLALEAASHGVPCLWSPGTSLAELIAEADSTIVPWDARAAAEQALALLGDDRAREQNLRALRRAASRLTWTASARRLIEVYDEIYAAPAVSSPAITAPVSPALEPGHRAGGRRRRWRGQAGADHP